MVMNQTRKIPSLRKRKSKKKKRRPVLMTAIKKMIKIKTAKMKLRMPKRLKRRRTLMLKTIVPTRRRTIAPILLMRKL